MHSNQNRILISTLSHIVQELRIDSVEGEKGAQGDEPGHVPGVRSAGAVFLQAQSLVYHPPSLLSQF